MKNPINILILALGVFGCFNHVYANFHLGPHQETVADNTFILIGGDEMGEILLNHLPNIFQALQVSNRGLVVGPGVLTLEKLTAIFMSLISAAEEIFGLHASRGVFNRLQWKHLLSSKDKAEEIILFLSKAKDSVSGDFLLILFQKFFFGLINTTNPEADSVSYSSFRTHYLILGAQESTIAVAFQEITSQSDLLGTFNVAQFLKWCKDKTLVHVVTLVNNE